MDEYKKFVKRISEASQPKRILMALYMRYLLHTSCHNCLTKGILRSIKNNAASCKKSYKRG